MRLPRVALAAAFASVACRHSPEPRPVAPTPGRDFVAGLPRCPADPTALPVQDLHEDAFGARVTVRGTLSLGRFKCTLKRCEDRDGEKPACCNGCFASWLLAESPGAAAERGGVALEPPGEEGKQLGIGARDCVAREIEASTPHAQVVVAGVFRRGEHFNHVIAYDRLCVVHGGTAPPLAADQ